MDSVLQQKYQTLQDILKSYERVVVAFSAGVDSTLLLRVAHDVLGDNAVAVTTISCTVPEREQREAQAFCQEYGIRHIECETHELDIDTFRDNPTNRCYLCKNELYAKIAAVAATLNIAVIVEGSNTDDLNDYRPGLAVLEEQGIKSPLRDAGLSKNDIRALSRELGLSTWNKQSFACLSSRFPYGDTISEEKLAMVDRAEQLLLDKGFTQVRVRIHGTLARIELPRESFESFMQPALLTEINDAFKAFGFTYVTLDIAGYRSGSMNEVL